MNPTPHIIPSALLLLATFFIGCLIGYAIRRMVRRNAAPAEAPLATSSEATEAVAPSTDEPVLGLLSAPLGEADDLKQIKGIGPKLEQRLNESGVYHYHQIAAWDARAVDAMNTKLGFGGRIERERWVSQAQSLVKEQAR